MADCRLHRSWYRTHWPSRAGILGGHNGDPDFSGELEWLPSGTRGDGFAVRNYILPSIVLGWLPAAAYLRLTRSSMLEVLESEYVKFARAKGVDSSFVIWKHAFRNAVIPPLTLSGLILIGFITAPR